MDGMRNPVVSEKKGKRVDVENGARREGNFLTISY